MRDKGLEEQTKKVASRDDFPITWFDRITLAISHSTKYIMISV